MSRALVFKLSSLSWPRLLHLGNDGVEVARVGEQRIDVVDDQRLAVARDAAREELGGVDREDVRAERGDLIVDALLRAGTGREHRDDGAHADDDAEHRQTSRGTGSRESTAAQR